MWPVQLILPDHSGTVPQKMPVIPAKGKSDPSIEPVTIKKRVSPLYPEQAKKLGIQGQVDLELFVDEQGKISNLKVLKSPHVLITQAALTTVKFWEFTPARKDGVPFGTKLIITINFRLK
jgi:protein TonB